MPLTKLEFRPGVNREATTLANEGGWFDGNNVRFRSGYPEKIGGWVADTGADASTLQPPANPTGYNTPSFWGICRNLWAWLNLAGYNLLGLGTNLKYYIQNGIGGQFNDVTPLRLTTSNTIGFTILAKSATTTTLTAQDPNTFSQAGDFVTYANILGVLYDSGLTAAVLNQEFQIQSVSGNSSYVIIVNAVSSQAVGTVLILGVGATPITAAYQLTTGSSVYTAAVGWGAGGWGGYDGGEFLTTLSTSISASGAVSTITVASTTGFVAGSTGSPGVIWIGTEGFTYTGGGGGGTTFTGVTRAYQNTPQTTHASGTTVYQYPTTGTLASTGWGLAAPAGLGVGVQLRLWSSANYGQDLIINPSGGALYYWAVAADPAVYNRALIMNSSTTITLASGATFTPDTTCPSLVNFVLVSDASNFVIAFGCNDPSGTTTSSKLDPMFIRWSAPENAGVWLPSITSQAGFYRLSQGSQIVTAIQTRQEILVLTDSAIYNMQYLGPPYVWGFQIMGENISIMGPNAITTVNNITYWMGYNKFYVYTGTVSTLPCAVRQFVFDNLNTDQSSQVYAGTNEAYNEIWWFYCSVTGTNADGTQGSGTPANPNNLMDRYVVYNYLDQTWYYGGMPRSSWLYTPLRQTPISTPYGTTSGIAGSGSSYGGLLVYQENGVDNGITTPPSAITSYIQSADFDIGDGNNFGFVWRCIPDINFTGSYVNQPNVTMTFLPRQFTGSAYGVSNNPNITSTQNYTQKREYIVQQFTPQIYVRARGRQMSMVVGSNSTGVAWQSGTNRLDIRPDGRR